MTPGACLSSERQAPGVVCGFRQAQSAGCQPFTAAADMDPPVNVEAGDESGQRRGDGLVLVTVHQPHRRKQLVPAVDKVEDETGSNAGQPCGTGTKLTSWASLKRASSPTPPSPRPAGPVSVMLRPASPCSPRILPSPPPLMRAPSTRETETIAPSRARRLHPG